MGEGLEKGVYIFGALFETHSDVVSVCDFRKADANRLTGSVSKPSWIRHGYLLDVNDIGVICPCIILTSRWVPVWINNTRATAHEETHLPSCTRSTGHSALVQLIFQDASTYPLIHNNKGSVSGLFLLSKYPGHISHALSRSSHTYRRTWTCQPSR
jgi:hypothetical protein